MKASLENSPSSLILSRFLLFSEQPKRTDIGLCDCQDSILLRPSKLRIVQPEDRAIDLENGFIFLHQGKGGKNRIVPIIDLDIDDEPFSETLRKWI